MTADDAGAREAHATATGSRDAREADNGIQPQQPPFTDEERVADPDAVIIEEVTEIPADEDFADDEALTAPPATGGAHARRADDTRPDVAPAGTAAAGGALPAAAAAGGALPADEEALAGIGLAGDPDALHQRWTAIQAGFVDDPRGSVAAAAGLVTETIATLVDRANEHEQRLRSEWEGDGTDTERLRNVLRSYRSLLDRLASR